MGHQINLWFCLSKYIHISMVGDFFCNLRNVFKRNIRRIYLIWNFRTFSSQNICRSGMADTNKLFGQILSYAKCWVIGQISNVNRRDICYRLVEVFDNISMVACRFSWICAKMFTFSWIYLVIFSPLLSLSLSLPRQHNLKKSILNNFYIFSSPFIEKKKKSDSVQLNRRSISIKHSMVCHTIHWNRTHCAMPYGYRMWFGLKMVCHRLVIPSCQRVPYAWNEWMKVLMVF